MLVVERNERISAQELVKKMKHLHDECKKGPSYCVQKEMHQSHESPKPKLQRREFRNDLQTRGKDNVPRVSSGDLASRKLADMWNTGIQFLRAMAMMYI